MPFGGARTFHICVFVFLLSMLKILDSSLSVHHIQFATNLRIHIFDQLCRVLGDTLLSNTCAKMVFEDVDT